LVGWPRHQSAQNKNAKNVFSFDRTTRNTVALKAA
jgi:hypothetical protein